MDEEFSVSIKNLVHELYHDENEKLKTWPTWCKNAFEFRTQNNWKSQPQRNLKTLVFFLLTLLRRTGSGLCAKTLHASCLCLLFNMFQNILRPLWPNVDISGLKGPETKTGKMENLQVFLFSAHISYGKGKYLNQTGFFLFSAHISYGKGKYLNQTGFFLQNLPRIIVYVIWRSTFTEFNWHKFSSMRYVFVKIFGLFWEWRKWPHNDPKMTPKMTKIQNFPNFHRFHAFFAIFSINIVD